MKPKQSILRRPPVAPAKAKASSKRGPYRKANPLLKRNLVLRLDAAAYEFIVSVTGLLRVKDRSAFVRLALARALSELPELIARAADLIAQKHIRREVSSKLGCAETVIDWGSPKAQEALLGLRWDPGSARKIDDLVGVIPFKREGDAVTNVGVFARTFPARALSPMEAKKIIDYLCTTESAATRPQLRAELDALVAGLIEESFARRKQQLLKVSELRIAAKEAGYKPAEISAHWNDPEMLQFLIDAKSKERWNAAEGLASASARSPRS